MARPPKWVSMFRSVDGWLPVRQYWRQINREQRAAEAQARADRKSRDKKRKKCRCAAYPWPHRPGGGLCRWPDPPTERWQRKNNSRPYRKRYLGIRRQIARATGLHPIRDRAKIDQRMPYAIYLAKQLKRQKPGVKYRNIRITDGGVTGSWQTAGPQM